MLVTSECCGGPHLGCLPDDAEDEDTRAAQQRLHDPTGAGAIGQAPSRARQQALLVVCRPQHLLETAQTVNASPRLLEP